MSQAATIEETFQAFDPDAHLTFEEPKERLSMNELGLGNIGAPSPVGVTSPFSLASLQGVIAMRRALLQKPVLDHHMMQSTLAGPHCQLRGMAPEAAKFIYDFWTNPKTLNVLSRAAGEDLVPVFDYELGHTNIQVPAEMDRREYVESLSSDPFARKVSPSVEQGEQPHVVGYHRDAYPWVCVLMLSDVTGMIGGETEIKRGDGTKIRALGPNIGSCVMMQGGFIEHCAMPCKGAPERITMVTSFRPRKKVIADMTNLKNICDCSNNYELYDQFARSRFDIIEEMVEVIRGRLRGRRKVIEEANGSSGGLQRPSVDLLEFQDFAQAVIMTLQNAVNQMAPYHSQSSDRFTPCDPFPTPKM